MADSPEPELVIHKEPLAVSTTVGYRPDVDGLRGIAVLAVVGFHAFPTWVPGGFIGVDVFFVISGFLISGLILAALRKGEFSLVDFYFRRIRRIFPALVVVLSACFAFGWLSLLADEFASLSKHIAGGAGFLSNFVLLQESGYFDYGAELKPLLHLWSLGIEEQFYIVWPVLLVAAWHLRRNAIAMLCIGLVAGSFVLNQYWLPVDRAESFYLPWMRCWELLSGALLAMFLTRGTLPKPMPRSLKFGMSVLGGVVVGMAIIVLDRHSAFPGAWALMPVLGTCAMIAGAGSWLNERVLANKVLVWFGLLSFPLYLWHWPLLAFIRIMDVEAPGRGLRVAAVTVAVALAWVTYRFVELPLRFGANRVRKAVILLIAMLSIGSVAYVTFLKHGVPSRLPENMQVALPPPSRDCEPGAPPAAKCWGPVGASQQLMLIGDSHAMSLAPGLAIELQARNSGSSLISVALPACMPLAGVRSFDANGRRQDCEAAFLGAFKYAHRQSSVTAVILSGRWASRVGSAVGFKEKEGGEARGRYEFIEAPSREPANSDAFRLGLRRSLSLLGSGKPVVFIEQVPELGLDPGPCAARPLQLAHAGAPPKCEVSLDEVRQRQAEYRNLADSVLREFPSVRRFDPVELLCRAARCQAVQQGRMLYRDDDHLNGNGAAVLAGALLRSFPWMQLAPAQAHPR